MQDASTISPIIFQPLLALLLASIALLAADGLIGVLLAW